MPYGRALPITYGGAFKPTFTASCAFVPIPAFEVLQEVELYAPVVDMPSGVFIPGVELPEDIGGYDSGKFENPFLFLLYAVLHGDVGIEAVCWVFCEFDDVKGVFTHEPLVLAPCFIGWSTVVPLHEDGPGGTAVHIEDGADDGHCGVSCFVEPILEFKLEGFGYLMEDSLFYVAGSYEPAAAIVCTVRTGIVVPDGDKVGAVSAAVFADEWVFDVEGDCLWIVHGYVVLFISSWMAWYCSWVSSMIMTLGLFEYSTAFVRSAISLLGSIPNFAFTAV
jgi:hypothetical protein